MPAILITGTTGNDDVFAAALLLCCAAVSGAVVGGVFCTDAIGGDNGSGVSRCSSGFGVAVDVEELPDV